MRDQSFNKLVALLETVEVTLNPNPPRIDEEEKKDHEGQMAYSQIESVMRNAKAIHDILKKMPEDANLKAWVQSKLTLADDYLVSVADYMKTEYAHDEYDPQEEDTAEPMAFGETENPPGNPTDEEAPTAPGNFTT